MADDCMDARPNLTTFNEMPFAMGSSGRMFLFTPSVHPSFSWVSAKRVAVRYKRLYLNAQDAATPHSSHRLTLYLQQAFFLGLTHHPSSFYVEAFF